MGSRGMLIPLHIHVLETIHVLRILNFVLGDFIFFKNSVCGDGYEWLFSKPNSHHLVEFNCVLLIKDHLNTDGGIEKVTRPSPECPATYYHLLYRSLPQSHVTSGRTKSI